MEERGLSGKPRRESFGLVGLTACGQVTKYSPERLGDSGSKSSRASSLGKAGLRHNRLMKEVPRHTLIRRPGEPKLEVGDTVPIKEGVVGVVLARFTPSGERINEVRYIVELKPDQSQPG
jgi:hypothetical protein